MEKRFFFTKVKQVVSELKHQGCVDQNAKLTDIVNRVSGQILSFLRSIGSFGGRSGIVQRSFVGAFCRSSAAPKKKAFDRGGPIWPPRSNAKDDCSRGGSKLPPAKNRGVWAPPSQNRKVFGNRKNEKSRIC